MSSDSGGSAGVDKARIEKAVREILEAIGANLDEDNFARTPQRVAEMYDEMFSGLWQRPEDVLSVTFEAEHEEMILVRDIDMVSMCAHHLVPFIGKAHVAYIPSEDGRVTGLSKLARLVDIYAKRPQMQERLTGQIADALQRVLQPRGVLVVIAAEHLCMSGRGVKKPGATTITSAVRGLFLEDARTRAEAMAFIQGR